MSPQGSLLAVRAHVALPPSGQDSALPWAGLGWAGVSAGRWVPEVAPAVDGPLVFSPGFVEVVVPGPEGEENREDRRHLQRPWGHLGVASGSFGSCRNGGQTRTVGAAVTARPSPPLPRGASPFSQEPLRYLYRSPVCHYF